MPAVFSFNRTTIFLAAASLFTVKLVFDTLVLNFGLYQKKYANADMLAISNNNVAVSFIKNFMEFYQALMPNETISIKIILCAVKENRIIPQQMQTPGKSHPYLPPTLK
jgi:hypothetical protein